MMNTPVGQVEFLLLVAALVAIVARRFKIPYIVGLVLAGIGVAALRLPIDIPLTRELVFYTLLPPLIFEAAFYIPWQELKPDIPVITAFAVPGLLLSAAVTAAGMHLAAGWDWPSCCVFGALIAATDPVSVIATFKEAGVAGRLRLLVEAESLLNDGTAAVVFTVALAFAAAGGAAGGIAPWHMLSTFLVTSFGGIACGLALGWGVVLLAGKTDDYLVEITFTTFAAYGSFMLAEHLGLSGVLACMAAGLLIGNRGDIGAIGDKSREAVGAFWEYAAFVANSLIFILIGMHEAKQDLGAVLVPALSAIGFVLLGRVFAVYPIALLFSRSRLKIDARHQHVLFWGGLRGALALALALGLPDDMPHREDIITVAFAVVAFSIFVQGMTMTPLLKRLGQLPSKN